MHASDRPILVIDCEDSTRHALVAVLTGRGYLVVTAPSGAAGADQAKRYSPRLIVLDDRVLDMRGEQYQFTGLTDALGASIPLVLLVRAGGYPYAAALTLAGRLEKPLDPDVLLAHLAVLCVDPLSGGVSSGAAI